MDDAARLAALKEKVDAIVKDIEDGTVIAMGFLNLTRKSLKTLDDNDKTVLTCDATKTLFKNACKVFRGREREAIDYILNALESPKCGVVQLYAGGDGWPFDRDPHLETYFLDGLCRRLPRTALVAINMGERDPHGVEFSTWWAHFLCQVKKSTLGHLWINEQGKGTCPLEVRGQTARRSPTGKPTGLQRALFLNRAKPEYVSLTSNLHNHLVLMGGLKCWRDYKSTIKQREATTPPIKKRRTEECDGTRGAAAE